MPYWMLDDKAPTHAKIKALTGPVLLDGDPMGVAAIGMWALAGAVSQAAPSDGLVSLADLVGAVPDRALAEQLAHRLVDAGLWHGHGHDCPRCDPVPAKHWRFHDWWDMRYKRGADMQLASAKARENKKPEVVNAVWLRDCIDPTQPLTQLQAHCRYCGKLVKRADRTSDDAPQTEHVNPRLAAGPRNLVVACGPCNRRKYNKTPAEAGMTLRPAPRELTEPADDTTTPPALAAAVSPGTPAAETPAEPAAEVDVDERADSSSPARAEPGADRKSPPTRGTRGRGPEHGRWSGSGSGSVVGLGSGEGSGSGSPAQPAEQPAARRSKRRRGRGGRSRNPESGTPQPDPPPVDPPSMDAGAAPLVFDPPTGGSPWKDWRGPRSPISHENVCPIHHQHVPCSKCATTLRET